MKQSEFDSLGREAQRVVEGLVGTPVASVTHIRSGVMNFTFDLQAADGRSYIARFYPAGRAHVVAYEPEVVRICRSRGMKVADVLATSLEGPVATLPYMIYRKLPGVALGGRIESLGDDSLRAISQFLLEQLAILGSIEVSGFGDLVNAGHAKSVSWQDYTSECFRLGIRSARSGQLVPPRLSDGLEELSGQTHRFEPGGSATLCWGDISPENVIVDPTSGAVGLVDFEGVIAAEQIMNLGYFRARYVSTRFYASFAEIWPRARDADVSAKAAFYVVVRALRLLSHGRAPLPTGAARDGIETFLPGLGGALDEALAWVRSGTT